MSALGNKEVMAKNIKRYLDELGISRREFCNRLGFKYSTVTDWLNAEKYPRIDKIEAMANFFGISKADLVEPYRPFFPPPPQRTGNETTVQVQVPSLEHRSLKKPRQPSEPRYYHDPEVAEMANQLKDNPDMRVLFDASRDLKKESIEEVVKFIQYQKAKERGEF
jgi:transcriptional regulator with XRE-family HTH domain